MENKNWIYFGAFLNDKSSQRLLSLSKVLSPTDWKHYCHHMTIAFNNKTEEAQEIYNYYKPLFGKEIHLLATHIGTSNDAFAVKIDFKGKTLNKIPHITLSTPPNGKPVNSNYITEWVELSKPIVLCANLGEFSK